MTLESALCAHEHVEPFIVDDPRLSNPHHRAEFLKCLNCGLLSPDPQATPATKS